MSLSKLAVLAVMVSQQWFSNPTVLVLGKIPDAENSCLIKSLKSQDPNMANEKRVFVLGILTVDDETTKTVKALQLSYCSIGDNGYAKKCAHAAIVTSNPKGWQLVGQSGTSYIMQSTDIGRYAEVTDAKTHQREYDFDISDCKEYFGIKQ